MFVYKFFCDNPEGIDYILEMQHEREFTHEEFKALCRRLLVQCLEEQLAEKSDYVDCQPDPDKMFALFVEENFLPVKGSTANFSFDPYLYDSFESPDPVKEILSKIEKYNHEQKYEQFKRMSHVE
jgi:hypothetical protein